MPFYLTRHGEAEHNLGYRFAGGGLDTALTPAGIAEAQERAARLVHLKLDFVVTSALQRSGETGRLIVARLQQLQDTVPVQIKTAFLNEVNGGSSTGILGKNLTIPSSFTEWNFPDGENFQQLTERVQQLWRFLEPYQDQSVLLIGHAMINRIILHQAGRPDQVHFRHEQVIRL